MFITSAQRGTASTRGASRARHSAGALHRPRRRDAAAPRRAGASDCLVIVFLVIFLETMRGQPGRTTMNRIAGAVAACIVAAVALPSHGQTPYPGKPNLSRFLARNPGQTLHGFLPRFLTHTISDSPRVEAGSPDCGGVPPPWTLWKDDHVTRWLRRECRDARTAAGRRRSVADACRSGRIIERAGSGKGVICGTPWKISPCLRAAGAWHRLFSVRNGILLCISSGRPDWTMRRHPGRPPKRSSRGVW
jgi:hypothetical protein